MKYLLTLLFVSLVGENVNFCHQVVKILIATEFLIDDLFQLMFEVPPMWKYCAKNCEIREVIGVGHVQLSNCHHKILVCICVLCIQQWLEKTK